MAHYALINEENIVIQVIVGANEGHDGKSSEEWEQLYEEKYNCKVRRTSYNTLQGKHYSNETGKWSKSRQFRGNYAGVGYYYDEGLDAFIPPKPFDSWVLNNETFTWDAPVPMPEDAGTEESPITYRWDEETTNWVIVEES